MITAQNNLIGRISAKQNITGKLNNAVVREYPELEDLTVTPSAEEQHFKSEKYGYNNVTVKAVEGEELNIIPSTETQVKEGLYNKVTVQGDSNLIPENIKEGTEIFVEKLAGEPGDKVTFDKVVYANGKVGNPYVAGAKVVGEIVKQGKQKKVIIFKSSFVYSSFKARYNFVFFFYCFSSL